MAQYITRIRTESGDLQIDYNALANLPVIDSTLSEAGQLADAKATGDAINALSTEVDSIIDQLHTDLEAEISSLEKTLNASSSETDTKITEITSNLTTFESETEESISQLSADKMNKSGDKMSGALDMSGNKITSVATPISNTDAANKAYVDEKYFKTSLTLSTSWVGDAAPYTQTLTATGIIESDCPHIAPVFSSTLETALEQKEAWMAVSKAEAGDNTIIFTCFEDKPAVEIPIQIEVHR